MFFIPRKNFPYFKTIAQSEMRAINRSAVLEYLRLAGCASRTELSEELNISMPTVMRIVDQLIKNGFVRSTGRIQGSMGPSRELLELNMAENLVVGIDFKGNHVDGVIASIGGQILHESHEAENGAKESDNFHRLKDFIDRMLQMSQEYSARILGVAVAIPGIVDKQNGVVTHAPSLQWKQFPLIERLKNHVSLPVVIENDVNLAALGEYWFGKGTGTRNMVMISIGTGIGAGIIMEGRLYRGNSYSSGEIGYFLPGTEYLDARYPEFGALETLASEKGIVERAVKKMQVKGIKQAEKIDVDYVLKALNNSEDWAVDLFSQTVDCLSLAVGNISVCLDPELIVLSGNIIDESEYLLKTIIRRLEGVVPTLPRLEASELKQNAPMLGAVVSLFQEVTGYSVVYGG